MLRTDLGRIAALPDDQQFLDEYEAHLSTFGLLLRVPERGSPGLGGGAYVRFPLPGEDWQVYTPRYRKLPLVEQEPYSPDGDDVRLDVPRGRCVLGVGPEGARMLADSTRGATLGAVVVRCASGRLFVVNLDAELVFALDPLR